MRAGRTITAALPALLLMLSGLEARADMLRGTLAGYHNETFSVAVGIGVMKGQADELVYNGDGSKLSHLIWTFDNVRMLKVEASARLSSWLRLGVIGQYALSGNSTMDDYDWLAPYVQYAFQPNWTDWSHHEDTELTDSTRLDIYAAAPLYEEANLQFSALAGFRRDHFKWQARGGSYVYSNYGFRDATGTFPAGELGISYEQWWSTPYIGAEIRAQYDKVTVRGKFIGSWWVDSEDVDLHHMRDLMFEERFDQGSMMSAELEASFRVTDRFSILGSYEYVNHDEVKGPTAVSDENTGAPIGYYDADAAGAILETHTVHLGVRYDLHRAALPPPTFR